MQTTSSPPLTPVAAAINSAYASEYQTRYVYVGQSNMVTDLRTKLTLSINALCRLLDGIQPKDRAIGSYLFCGNTSIEKVDAYGYFPGQARIVEEKGVKYLNQWTALDFEAIAGDVTPFLNLVTYLFDDQELTIEFVLNWLAFLVQYPGKKLATTILLTSRAEGIGKGIFAMMCATVVGLGNTRFLSSEALASDFNEWLGQVILVIVEEFEEIAGRAGMARLKNYITDDNADINVKHGPRIRARNVANFLMFSNEASPLKLNANDRRFVVHRSQAQPKTEAEYSSLVAWFRGDGHHHLLHFLRSRNLSAFNPHARGPNTASHQEMVENARDPHTAYLHHAFEAQEAPFCCELVVVKHVVDHVNSVGRVRLTTRVVEDFLRNVGAIRLTRQYRLAESHAGRNYVWVIRNGQDWGGDISVDAVRRAYVHPDASPAIPFSPIVHRFMVPQRTEPAANCPNVNDSENHGSFEFGAMSQGGL